jgi:hypothetical protein
MWVETCERNWGLSRIPFKQELSSSCMHCPRWKRNAKIRSEIIICNLTEKLKKKKLLRPYFKNYNRVQMVLLNYGHVLYGSIELPLAAWKVILSWTGKHDISLFYLRRGRRCDQSSACNFVPHNSTAFLHSASFIFLLKRVTNFLS